MSRKLPIVCLLLSVAAVLLSAYCYATRAKSVDRAVQHAFEARERAIVDRYRAAIQRVYERGGLTVERMETLEDVLDPIFRLTEDLPPK
jgi:deoxyadenosine/deoxycytidine kinase